MICIIIRKTSLDTSSLYVLAGLHLKILSRGKIINFRIGGGGARLPLYCITVGTSS